jgi:PAS domain S-box-containing protein
VYLQFHVYQLPWFLAAATMLSLSWVSWRRRHIRGAVALAGLLLALSIWSAFDGLGLMAVGLRGKTLMSQLSYIGIASIPPFWLIFAMQYLGYGRYLTRRAMRSLTVIPVATLALAFTNSWHHLLWSEIHLVYGGPFVVAYFGRGPWFWINAAYTYLLIVTGLVLCGRVIATGASLYRRQSWVILVGTLVPLAGNLLYLLRSTPFNGVDLTALLFAASGILLAIGFMRFRLLDIVPVARDMVLQGLDSGIIVVDVAGRIVDMNPAAERVFGIPASRAVGQAAADAIESSRIGSQNVGALLPYRDIHETHTELDLTDENESHCYDMTITPLHDRHGRSLGRTIILIDITARRKTEQALMESERRYRTLFQADQDAVLMRAADGTIVDCNPAAGLMFRCDPKALLGCCMDGLMAAGEWERLQTEMGTLGAPIDATGQRPEGGEFPVEVVIRHLTIAGDQVSLVWMRDVTARKRIEAQLQHAQRLEAVGRLAGGIAHEFNNLLTVINGYSHMLLQSTAAEDPDRLDIERIYQAGTRAADLTRRLLAFSRRRPRETERLDLNELLREMEPQLSDLLGPDRQLALRCAAQSVPIAGNVHDIQQLVLALASNASDAMSQGGTFTVSVERSAVDVPIVAEGVKIGRAHV